MVTTRDVHYDVDGHSMIGRMAGPDGTGTRPGILIAHEGPGLDDHQRDRAAVFAEMGYVAFALDYQGGGQVILDREEMAARLGELAADPDRIRARGSAGLKVLLDEPRVDPSRIAALGYCFGGALVLELARTGADLKAVVGFHPGLGIPKHEDNGKIKAKVLMCIGSEDPLIPREDRLAFEERMTASGVDWQMIVYGGQVHSFTHPRAELAGIPYIRYDRLTDERSWKAMVALLDEAFA
jgi:dienelactone hydrolase